MADGVQKSAASGDDDLPDIIDVVMEVGRPDGLEKAPSPAPPVATPAEARLPGHLEELAGRARDYVEAASSANTRRAYASDWRHFASWCRRQGFSLMPPDPQVVGLYITALASGTASEGKKSVSTTERRLSSLSWNYAQRGLTIDRKDRHIATVMAGIRNKHVCRPFAARWPRLVGRGRRTLCAKATRPRLRRDDPQVSTAARSVPSQSHQGERALRETKVPSPAPLARVPSLETQRHDS
jgi:hypothetical protein